MRNIRSTREKPEPGATEIVVKMHCSALSTSANDGTQSMFVQVGLVQSDPERIC